METPNKEKQQKTIYQIKPSELPLHCPTEQNELWCMHPKVYLPIKQNGGDINCPYCGSHYHLNQ